MLVQDVINTLICRIDFCDMYTKLWFCIRLDGDFQSHSMLTRCWLLIKSIIYCNSVFQFKSVDFAIGFDWENVKIYFYHDNQHFRQLWFGKLFVNTFGQSDMTHDTNGFISTFQKPSQRDCTVCAPHPVHHGDQIRSCGPPLLHTHIQSHHRHRGRRPSEHSWRATASGHPHSHSAVANPPAHFGARPRARETAHAEWQREST